MEPVLYEEMFRMEQHYWWHRGKRYFIHRLLRRFLQGAKGRLLIPGVGTGYLQMELQGRYEVVGLDFSAQALSFCKSRGCEKLALADLEQGLPFAPDSFDGILAFDVLEHLEQDDRFLCECFRVLRPGAFLLVGVPAFPAMWSLWDEMLHHKRRYLRRGLSRQISGHRFDLVYANYYNMLSYPPAFVIRKLKKHLGCSSSEFVRLPEPANKMMTAVFQAELAASLRIPLPFGLSCAAVGRKPLS